MRRRHRVPALRLARSLLLAALGGMIIGISSSAPGQTPDRDASIQAFRGMLDVLRHPRCLNCHPSGDFPRQGDDRHRHRMLVMRGPDDHGNPDPPVLDLPPDGQQPRRARARRTPLGARPPQHGLGGALRRGPLPHAQGSRAEQGPDGPGSGRAHDGRRARPVGLAARGAHPRRPSASRSSTRSCGAGRRRARPARSKARDTERIGVLAICDGVARR